MLMLMLVLMMLWLKHKFDDDSAGYVNYAEYKKGE